MIDILLPVAVAILGTVVLAALVVFSRRRSETRRERALLSRWSHPSVRYRIGPRSWQRGRRLSKGWVDFLVAMHWGPLVEQLESGEVYDPVGEQIRREHDRNVAEMPEIDGGDPR